MSFSTPTSQKKKKYTSIGQQGRRFKKKKKYFPLFEKYLQYSWLKKKKKNSSYND